MSAAEVPLASYTAGGGDLSALAGPSGIFPDDTLARSYWGNVEDTYGGAADQEAYQKQIAFQFGATPMETLGSVPDNTVNQSVIMDENMANFQARQFENPLGASVFSQGYGVLNSNHVIMPRKDDSVRAALDTTQIKGDWIHPEEGINIVKQYHKPDDILQDNVHTTFVPRNPANRSDKGINPFEDRRWEVYSRGNHASDRVGSKQNEAPPGTQMKEYDYNVYTGKQWDRPESGAKFMRRLHKPSPGDAHKQRNLSDFERMQYRQSQDRSYTPLKVADQDPQRNQTLYDTPKNADVSEMVQYESFEVPRGVGHAGVNENMRMRPDHEQSLRMPKSVGDEPGGTTVFNRWGNPKSRWNVLAGTSNEDRLQSSKQAFATVRGGYDPVGEVKQAVGKTERLDGTEQNDGGGEFGVGPEWRHTMRRSLRGTEIMGVPDTTQNYSRAGNKRNLGGVGAYAIEQETASWHNSLPQSKDRGRYESERFSAPYQKDGGIAGAWAGKHFGGESTRGGQRAGGPKRQDYMVQTGIESRGIPHLQTAVQNLGFYGIRDDQRRTPVVSTQDPGDFHRIMQRQRNPFAIPSYADLQANEMAKIEGVPGYKGGVRDANT